MINLSTPNDILYRELMADKVKTLYWLKKKNGGDRKYEQMRNNLLLQAKKEKRNCTSEILDYRSTNGNRWMTYECARYFPEADTSYSSSYAFCFYETYGSVGAFMPVTLGLEDCTGDNAIVIFTSHFFQQMSERLGIGYRSPEMVRAFHAYIPHFMVKTYRDEEDGNRNKLIVRLPGSTGWGIMREGTPAVFEVRTFLTDAQLNGKQKRLTSELREKAEKVYYEPESVMVKRLKDKIDRGENLEGDIIRFVEKYKAMGLEESMVNDMMNVCLWMSFIYSRMGLIDADDVAASKRYRLLDWESIETFIREGDGDGEKFLDLLAFNAQKMGFHTFDRAAARNAYFTEAKRVNGYLEKFGCIAAQEDGIR